MYYIDMPSIEEIDLLNQMRADACVSIYLPTTPVSLDIEQSRINLGNLVKKAVAQLEAADYDRRGIKALQAQFADLLEDMDFWHYQANSLAILATPDSLHTYRMANKLTEAVEVSDRFHLKPLLRALTFPHAAFVLALSEKAVRLIQISADLPAKEVQVPNMPLDAASAGGKATSKDYSGRGHRHGAQGENFYLVRYVRKIDAALRSVLAGSNLPLILATAKPLESLFRSVSVIPALAETIAGNPDHLNERELAEAARPILDAHYAEQVQNFHRLFEQRTGQKRTTTDISDAARLATFGGIERLLVDIDSVIDGFIDDATGKIILSDQSDAADYDIIDEITGRALRSGAKVMAVRKADIPGGHDLAVITRYPV